MEHITKNHWYFAVLFVIAFISFMVWSYRKDRKTHRIHYKGSGWVIVGIIAIAALFYLLNKYLR